MMRRVIDSPNILFSCGNNFSQILNVHGVNYVRQTEMHIYSRATSAEPRAFEVEMAIEKLKRNKSPGTDQIPAELI